MRRDSRRGVRYVTVPAKKLPDDSCPTMANKRRRSTEHNMGRPIDIALDDSQPGIDETADKLRADFARRRGERAENATEVLRQLDDEARRKAEEKAARELAERLRLAAEEQARRLAEEQARIAAAEQARREAEEAAQRAAAEQARREAEEARQRAEDERRRLAAERKARAEARERARIEEEERDRAALQERLRQRRERRQRVLWPLLLGLLLPPLLILGFLQLYSFESRRAGFEQSASALFGVPVKIGSAKLALLPQAQWRLHDVSLGGAPDTASIAVIAIDSGWSGIFSELPAYHAIHVERALLPPRLAMTVLEGAANSSLLASGELDVKDLMFTTEQKDLPPLNLRARFQDGRLIALSGGGEGAETGRIKVDLRREEQWRLALEASQTRWLLGASSPLTDLSLKGNLNADGLRFTELAATALAGELTGDGMMSWREGWRLSAKITARRIDASKLARGWIGEGLAAGNTTLVAGAAHPRELLSRLAMAGSFELGRGELIGVDLDRALQQRGGGSEFRFESLAGDLAVEDKRIELSRLRLLAPGLKAGGELGFDARGTANGRLTVEALTPGPRRALNLKLGGTLATPNYQR